MVYGRYNYSSWGLFHGKSTKINTHIMVFIGESPNENQPTNSHRVHSVSGGNSDGLNESHMVGKWWVVGKWWGCS